LDGASTYLLLFCLLSRRRPTSTLFPYTTLFRSLLVGIRAQDALPGLLAYTLDAPAMTPVRHARLVGSLVEHARFLMQYDTATIKDRKSTRLNSSHVKISYAVFCLKKKSRAYSRT